MTRWYVGLRLADNDRQTRTPFTAEDTPTRDTHGNAYIYVVGPFRNRHAAAYFADNPSCSTVARANHAVAQYVDCRRCRRILNTQE